MAIFRVERTNDYTVMSNHHLRNKALSLKAKGLLSQMLSLPEDWDYTLSGLATINRESVDAIRSAVQELEKAGYITRRQCRDERGKLSGNEYTIYEYPHECTPTEDTPPEEEPEQAPPLLDFPTTENPLPDNPLPEKPLSENPTQLNKDILNKDLSKKESKKKKRGGASREPKPKPDTLEAEALSKYIIDWISREGTPLGWSREEKNAVYRAMTAFYLPREEGLDPSRLPSKVHTLQGRLLRFSEGNPGYIVDMLERAFNAGWREVFDSPDYHKGAKAPPERVGEEWL